MTTVPMPLMRTLIKNRCSAGLLAVSLGAFGTLAIAPAHAVAMQDQNQTQDDGSFWTRFVPSEDTRLIFVSSSEGSDSNSGLTPDRPVKSLSRAYDLLRDGYPDWMLLKRGDVWYESFPRWSKSGRAEDEKLVVGAYGESSERPQIRPDGGVTALPGHGSDAVAHIVFVGFHLEPNNRTADQGGGGIGWLKESDDILFEDLYIDGFATNVNLQAFGGPDKPVRNIRFNGCVIVDAWNNNGHSQGLFAKGIDGLTIENSVFDHNGWNLAMGAEPTIFNHNIYIQLGCEDVVLRNSTISNGSSHGVQMRSGGVVENNIFLLNPISVLFGGGYNPSGTISGSIQNNLILDGKDMNNSAPRGWAIDVQNANPVIVQDNFILNSSMANMPRGLHIKDDNPQFFGVHNASIISNVFAFWSNPIMISEANNGGMSNITVASNAIIPDTDSAGQTLVSLRDSRIPNLDFSLNAYYLENTDESVFNVDGSPQSYLYWQQQIEPSSELLNEPISRTSLGISAYFQNQGLSVDNTEFLESERSISRNSEYTSPRIDIIQWHHHQIGR